MSQYVSTIANNGYRIQPHIGLAIHESTNKDELGPLKRKIKGNVLNRVNNSENEIKEVQDGFKMAFNEKDGTGYASFRNTVVPSAGKTGTAEVFQNGEPRVNSTYIGYAPIKDPKLSFSIVYTNQPVPPPWLNGGDLGRDVINYYFRDREKKITTIPINHRKLKAINKIMIQTQIVILTMMRNKFIRNIKNYSLQLHL